MRNMISMGRYSSKVWDNLVKKCSMRMKTYCITLKNRKEVLMEIIIDKYGNVGFKDGKRDFLPMVTEIAT